MGVNSRRRKAGRQRRSGTGPFGWDAPAPEPERRRDGEGAQATDAVRAALAAVVHQLAAGRRDPAEAASLVELTLCRVRPVSPYVVQEAAGELVAGAVDRALAGGWSPGDLVELVRRGSHASRVPTLLTALHEEARRNPARGPAWLAALATYGDDPRRRRDSTDGLTSALVVVALLGAVPMLSAEAVLEEPGGLDDAVHPKLARVRALLAKAESTTFPEEAEALSAKAQELIARYSLDALVDQGRAGAPGGGDLVTRRIWLDPPYVGAKASLVQRVAAANHARAASQDRFGYCVVVGARHDLDAVELLVTSLLVQADRAMLAHGRRLDRVGTSRTRSFRHSFLLAYASRVGERLRKASEDYVARDAGAFLPVLRSHDEQVGSAFAAMVPHTVGRARSVGNHEGWVAGVAAADLAHLGVRGQVGGSGG